MRQSVRCESKLGRSLEAKAMGCDVNSIAVDAGLVKDDITLIDADAEVDAATSSTSALRGP